MPSRPSLLKCLTVFLPGTRHNKIRKPRTCGDYPKSNMATKSDLLERLRVALKLKNRDWKTIDSYSRTVSYYLDYARAHGRGLSSEQIAEGFLTMRVTKYNVSASTQNHDLAALNALYESQGRKLGNVDALRAKRHTYARHCPSREEVIALLGALEDTAAVPARFVALWLYGCGLRVNEGLEVRLKDVRVTERRVVLREPKHGHDRVVMIPHILLEPLQRQIEHAKRVFALEEARPKPLPLQVPNAIGRKYPRAPHSLGWAFLFPAPRPMRLPVTKEFVRWHLPDWTIQQAFSQACDKAQLIARITPHCLRHAFGTHFEGDIRDLQAILGHKSLETTQTYRHPHLERARSPIESLPLGSVLPFPGRTAASA